MKTISIYIFFLFAAGSVDAQNWRIQTEFGSLFNRSYYDQPWEGQLNATNPFAPLSGEGNVDSYFQVFYSKNLNFGISLSKKFKNGLALELGANRSQRAVTASVDIFAFDRNGKKAYGDVIANYHQIDVPVRLSFPIYLTRSSKQLKSDLKKGKNIKHIKASIGLFASFLENDFLQSGKRGRFDKPNPSGGFWEMQYELRPSTHRKFGLGAELGIGWEYPVSEKISLTTAIRSTIGLSSMTTYEFFYLFSFGEDGSGAAQFKNDSFSLNLGASYAF